MRPTPKILLIYTGGTIGMVREFDTGALSNFNFDKLQKYIPELKLLTCEIDTISFDTPIDSSNMNPTYWVQLAEMIETNYNTYDGFVVLHGSDTMSYTASVLSFMLENLSKPVIFTGSQLPIGDLRTDAKENLITSIQIAALHTNGQPKVKEVGLYFEYKLYRANRTTKINADYFEAFASLNYPPLAVSGVDMQFHDEALFKPKGGKKLKVSKKLGQGIVLLKVFPGLDQNTLQHLLTYDGLKGLIIETFGSGNVTSESWFLDCIASVIDRRIPVVNVTQCSGGSVSMGRYETSVGLKRIGVVSGKDITTEAALGKMMYLLGQDVTMETFKTIFETSLRGEMS